MWVTVQYWWFEELAFRPPALRMKYSRRDASYARHAEIAPSHPLPDHLDMPSSFRPPPDFSGAFLLSIQLTGLLRSQR